MNENEKKKFLETLEPLFKNEIRITPERSETPLPADASKIGGKPSLPRGFAWPTFAGREEYCFKRDDAYDDDGEPVNINRPLAFLAQFNMKDTAPMDKDGLLPQTGMLSFFYDLETEPWGIEPEDKGSARVFYFPEVSDLSAADFPEGLYEEYKLPEFVIKLESHISCPSDDAINLNTLRVFSRKGLSDMNDDELLNWIKSAIDEFESFLDENGLDVCFKSKLLGYSDAIQSSEKEMAKQCETATRGYQFESQISDWELVEIADNAPDWILLFQMHGINGQPQFGDDGNIYFWIRKQDLANKDFSKIWLILEC